jgi:hypothetical protein
MGKPSQSDFVGVSEAATILGVSERQARYLVSRNPAAQQIGRNWIIRRADLAKIPKNRKPGRPPKPSTD